MSKTVVYYEGAAEQSRDCSRQWLRYLSKLWKNDKCILSDEEIDALYSSDKLNMYQKVSFKRAMIPGTPTNKYVVQLRKPAGTPLIDAIREKYKK